VSACDACDASEPGSMLSGDMIFPFLLFLLEWGYFHKLISASKKKKNKTKKKQV